MKKKFPLLLFLISFSINAQLLFEDVATLKGVGVSYGTGNFGGGISFCDYDNDGWDDITISSETGEKVKVFRNVNGSFQLVSMPFSETFQTKQIIWVDIDNDGDKDFHAVSDDNVNVLYRNDGNNQFTNISATSGLFTSNLYSFGTSWGDYNSDGYLDVFISNLDNITQNQRNYLYKNNGDNTFTDVTASSGIDFDNNLTFCVAFFDYDNDGDQDIYLANDRTTELNKLYRNNGNETFTDVSAISNTDVSMSAMSTTIDDYNNDGWLDIYITNTASIIPGAVEGNALLENNGDGTFTNVAVESGTQFSSFGWGAVFLDADLNGDKDLYVSGPLDGSVPSLLPSAFYENDGDNTYTIPSNIGFQNDTRESYANALGDFNNDGKPDIVVLNEDENIFLWENKSTNTGNYLKVKLEGTQSNRDGIGSWIEVSAGGKVQYSYTLCGEGYISQNSNTEIIGIGNATNIDYVKVTWLSGIVDTFTNVAPNQTLTIVENSSTLSSNNFSHTEFKVLPNPTQGEIVISSNNSLNLKIKIVDLMGRIVYKNNSYTLNTSIDLESHPDGIYTITISSDTEEEVIKIVKY